DGADNIAGVHESQELQQASKQERLIRLSGYKKKSLSSGRNAPVTALQ
ncbi:unnamed protein product, partial [Tetraodon nigroviridis]